MGTSGMHLATGPITMEIIETMAEHLDVTETNLPPLFESIDPDALEVLYLDTGAERSKPFPNVRFDYCGHTIVINERRVISIE